MALYETHPAVTGFFVTDYPAGPQRLIVSAAAGEPPETTDFVACPHDDDAAVARLDADLALWAADRGVPTS